MNKELERARRAFRAQEPIQPPDAVRRNAIAEAMARFEEENADAAQGSEDRERLMKDGGAWTTGFRWRRIMNIAFPARMGLLAGGVSLAALSVFAFNSGLLNDILRSSGGPQLKVDSRADQAANAPVSLDAAGERVTESRREIADISLSEAVPAEHEIQSAAPPQSMAAKPKSTVTRALLQSGAAQRGREADAVASASPGDYRTQHGYQDQGRDRFADITPNQQKLVSEAPVSTFSIDVDTASYAFVRAALNRGVLPQKDAVRVEEMINYFDYGYPVPDDRSVPFNADISVMPTPWNAETKLLRIGIKGYDLQKAEAPRANLVFLVDTSGSMNAPDKLPLLRNALKLLVSSLKPDDTVAIVAYAGSAGTVLEPTAASDKAKILSALDGLGSGGSTAGAEGIRQAYQLAESGFDGDGVNRVILATDGDFNVGITDTEELKSFIERKRETGIGLSVLGFGHGNYNDELMQALAQNGNGNAAYIDTLNEARKTLVAEAGSTLFTIARDVKIQVEFNPAAIREYRLIGYETRQLRREDFNNDRVDAGDIGAGHSVTALYELTPAGSAGGLIDDLRYRQTETPAAAELSDEYGYLKIRYKQPDSDTSELIGVPITADSEVATVEAASNDTRFAAAVAAFGQVLRGGRHTGSFDYDDIIALARSGKGDDPYGYRGEFITLVELAKSGQALQPLKE
ncbi:VWA domain-containing protein [Nitratireductor sp. XY-223]|uniref:vWA domain-containing protein n=1 Tax=Nitratireductor sp. XY-223 TaxID=2561926 RepID=UPI0010AA9B25|nr:VWA domain-containing protein [Nitratireductor sp. XY-223]